VTHRRWIVVNALGLTTLSNLVINGGIAWLSAVGRTHIPSWAPPVLGGPSTITDTLGTLFLLPFITCLIVTSAVWRERRRGRLGPVRHSGALACLPRRTAARGVVFGAVCVGALGPVVVATVAVTGVGDLSIAGFVLYKAILGVGLGAVVTPAIALSAMAE
jgi:hypothetical protein